MDDAPANPRPSVRSMVATVSETQAPKLTVNSFGTTSPAFI